ncbi:hypothetical protein PR048_012322 [Dryococelus australis]|uniref:Uncharacterized protein n=1 Tax=Dryococelus australis TaxID=614101 RepID=A0ABQ9HP26_9NEOP|nr:hypothetical protein PR048_012322 [Dryococelus australis]
MEMRSGAISSIQVQSSIGWNCFQRRPDHSKKSRLQKSKFKTMLIAFFGNDGIIQKEFVSAGQTVNAASYEQVLKRLLQRIRRIRPELHRTGK